MANWYMENKNEISAWKGWSVHHNLGRFFLPPDEEEILDLQTVASSIAKVKTWVRAKVQLAETTAKPWHTICEKCTRFVNTEPNERTYCNSSKEWMTTRMRIKLFAYLTDENNRLPTTISSPEAEYLLNMTADQIEEAHTKGINQHQKLTDKVQGRSVVCFIRSYDLDYKGTKSPRFPTLKLFLDDELPNLRRTNAGQEEITQHLLPAPTQQPGIDSIRTTGKDKPESQLFTPTMQKELEKTASQEKGKDALTSTCKGVKRQI